VAVIYRGGHACNSSIGYRRSHHFFACSMAAGLGRPPTPRHSEQRGSLPSRPSSRSRLALNSNLSPHPEQMTVTLDEARTATARA